MNANWGECYYDHFAHFLGQPLDRKIFRQSDDLPSIQILSYDKVFQGCQVFCSLGLSQYSLETGGVTEVCLPIDDGLKDVPYILANTLFFMTKNRMNVGWGVSVGGIERISPHFVSYSNKTAIYFTNIFDLPNNFSKVKCANNLGSVYLAMFISEAERAFFKQNGAEKFETLLEDKHVDPFVLRRLSSI